MIRVAVVAALAMPGMSVSLPGEDVALGTEG